VEGTTLKELSAFLKTFAEEQDREMRKSGKSAYETLPGGVKVSRLFLSIDAEPSVPWQHVQWLMTVAAEQKYCKLELSDGTRRLLAYLQLDKALEGPVDLNGAPVNPPLEIKLSVHVVSRLEKPAKWGDVDVLEPTEVRYELGAGNEETAALAGVRDYVTKAYRAVKDTPNARISGEIKAGHKAPFARILDVMEAFRGRGAHERGLPWQGDPGCRVARGSPPPLPAQELRRGELTAPRDTDLRRRGGATLVSMHRPGVRATREDYERLPEHVKAELIEGEVVATPTPTAWHERLVTKLIRRLCHHLGDEADDRLQGSRTEVSAWGNGEENVLQPDVVVFPEGTKPTGRDWRPPTPLWVAEVLSPSTAKRDRGIKIRLYAAAGVREVWLVDPDAETVEVLDLSTGARRVFAKGEQAASVAIPGFAADVAGLFAV